MRPRLERGAKWVPREVDDDKAIQIRDEFGRGIDELFSPDVFLIEVAHALAKAERRGDIKPGEGARKMADVFAYMPALHQYPPPLPRAFTLDAQARIGVYDCLYVALAEQEGCERLTADDRLVRVLRPTFTWITPLASLP